MTDDIVEMPPFTDEDIERLTKEMEESEAEAERIENMYESYVGAMNDIDEIPLPIDKWMRYHF